MIDIQEILQFIILSSCIILLVFFILNYFDFSILLESFENENKTEVDNAINITIKETIGKIKARQISPSQGKITTDIIQKLEYQYSNSEITFDTFKKEIDSIRSKIGLKSLFGDSSTALSGDDIPDDISVPENINEEDIGNFDNDTADNQAVVDKEIAEGEAIINNTPDPTTANEVVKDESELNNAASTEIDEFDKDVPDDCPDCVKHTRRDRANEETTKEPRETKIKASLL